MTQFNIITLCASHICDLDRLRFLQKSIQYHLQQSVVPPLYVSVSCDPLYQHEMSNVLLTCHTRDNVRVFVQERQMSQFEHYMFLTQQIDPLFVHTTWCLFMDDDDYVHPQRSQKFIELIHTVPRNEVCCRHPTMMMSQWESKDDISHIVLNNKLMACTTKGTEVLYPCNEYVTYAVKLSTLMKFCHFMQKQKCLNTKQCDLVFSAMLFHLCKKVSQLGDVHWLYAYNQDRSHNRVCHTVDVEYYANTYSEVLFDDLMRTFEFKWDTRFPKGSPFVYSDARYKRCITKKRIVNMLDVITYHAYSKVVGCLSKYTFFGRYIRK